MKQGKTYTCGYYIDNQYFFVCKDTNKKMLKELVIEISKENATKLNNSRKPSKITWVVNEIVDNKELLINTGYVK